jgi:TolB-like protein
MAEVNRRLAGILAADVVGYSAKMGADDAGTLDRVRALRTEIIEPLSATYGGRLFKTMGDGFLLEFASAVQALRCAIAIQTMLNAQTAGLRLRIGVHQGEVVPDGDDLFGDGVLVAARLEPLAEPGGICISSRVREDASGKMALEVDDLGEPPLKNIAAKIRAFRVRLGAPERPAQAPVSSERPSLAVLPFQNMSGDAEQEYFADGVVEDITTALSRIRTFFVIARNSAFAYKGKSPDARQVGRELGVRYILEGSVRKVADRVRITGQLIDTTTGAHIWADRFDGDLADIFDVQDRVTASVAGAIEPALLAAEMLRSAQRQTNDLTAYDLYLRGLADVRSWEKERLLRGLALYRQAIERDPHYGIALIAAARCHTDVHVNGWTDDQDRIRREGLVLAQRALSVAGDNPVILADGAYVLGYFGEEITVALALVDRALGLNPSFALGWMRSGWIRSWAGQPDLAIDHFENFVRFSPRESRVGPNMGIGVCHFFARRFEEAKAMLLLSLHERSNWVPTHRFLASCYAHMGRIDEARDAIRRIRELTAVLIPSVAQWRNPGDRELFLSGLRLAAGETKPP